MTSITTSSIAAICSGSSSYRDYLLAELRCAALRAKLWQNDIEAIAIGLKACLIDADQAIEHLSESGMLRLIAPSSTCIPT
jgi:hypothetical protein